MISDAAKGSEIWSVQTVPTDQPYTMTMAPRVAKNKVVVGNASAEKPVRGYFSAYNVDTGKLEWRFYTVPGDPSKGFENKAMEMAAKTWGGEWWKMGEEEPSGTRSPTIPTPTSFSWVLAMADHGLKSCGNPRVWTTSLLLPWSRWNADTGEYKWHYQFVPGDSWDYDSVQQLTVADLRINGQNRKVVMQANKDGFFYVLDRTNGKVISAEPYVQVNWASEIDLKTGRPMTRPEAFYGKDKTITVMPGAWRRS